MTESRKSEIIARIEVLENAAALIAMYGEEGQMWVEDDDDYEVEKYCNKYKVELANQLNGRANKMRVKYGLKPNKFKYNRV